MPTGGAKFTPSSADPARRHAHRRVVRRSIPVVAPAGATAVAVTLTVVNGATAGFVSAYPCGGTVPVVANVNWGPGEIVAGAAFVPVAADGTFCVFANSPVDVVVDLTGTFGPTQTLRFVPSSPTRMVDTRAPGQWKGPIGRGQTIDVAAAPSDAVAVTGTLVLIEPYVDSYLTGTPCGVQPGQTSSVSAARLGDHGQRTHRRRVGGWHHVPVLVRRRARGLRHDRVVDRVIRRRRSGRLAVSAVLVALAVAGASSGDTTHAEPRPEHRAAIAACLLHHRLGRARTRGRRCLRRSGATGTSTFDGFPALMVSQMEDNHVRKAPAEIWGDSAVVAGGYNYPYWDPALFDRQIDSIIAAFEERGVHQGLLGDAARGEAAVHHGVGVACDPALLLVLPDGQRAPPSRPPAPRQPDARRLGCDRRSLPADVRRDPPQRLRHLGVHVARRTRGEGCGRADPGRDDHAGHRGRRGGRSQRCDGRRAEPRRDRRSPRRVPHCVSVRGGAAARGQPQLRRRRDRVGSGDRRRPARTAGVHLQQRSGARDRRRDGLVPCERSVPPRRARPGSPTRATSGTAVAGGSELRVQLPASAASAGAAVLNVTAIGGDRAGFVTAYRCGDPVPATSNVNFAAGSITPNLAVVAPDASGAVCLRPNQSAHLVVDLFGALVGDRRLVARRDACARHAERADGCRWHTWRG